MTIITKNDYVLIRINCEIYNPIFFNFAAVKSPGATCITFQIAIITNESKSDSKITFLI